MHRIRRYRDQLLFHLGFDPSRPLGLDALRERVEHMTVAYRAPQFVRSIPAAPETLDVRTRLLATDDESAPATMEFSGPVMLVGLQFEVTHTSWAGTIGSDVGLRDFDVKVQLRDNDLCLAGRQRGQQGSGPGPAGFVPAIALDLRTVLLMRYLDEGAPRLFFTYRSRYGATGNLPDVDIDAIAHFHRLDLPED